MEGIEIVSVNFEIDPEGCVSIVMEDGGCVPLFPSDQILDGVFEPLEGLRQAIITMMSDHDQWELSDEAPDGDPVTAPVEDLQEVRCGCGLCGCEE